MGARRPDAQVVLSRRVYAEHGRTFAQIWMADEGTLNFWQLTHSARDHSELVCSRDGKLIYFCVGPRWRALPKLVRRPPERTRGSGRMTGRPARNTSYGALRATSGWPLTERLRMADCSYAWAPNCAAWSTIHGSSKTSMKPLSLRWPQAGADNGSVVRQGRTEPERPAVCC